MNKISILGDVFLDKSYKINFNLDNFIFNLEAPISNKKYIKPVKNKVNLIMKEDFIFETFNKYPIAVNLSNNHIFDYGDEVFEDTINFLKEKNICFFGAGNKESNFNNPFIFNIGKKKISFLGYTCNTTHPSRGEKYSVSEINVEKIKEEIIKCKKISDFVVLIFHWGMEECPYPKFEDVLIAHKCIDFGADLIIGHHAHMMQSIEKYKGKYIFYGIGNFIFPDLNLPAYYNGSRFTQNYIKKQLSHNKKSIIVEIDEMLNVSYFTVFFNKGEVVKKKFKVPTFIPSSSEEFIKKCKWFKKIKMIKKIFYEPKIPTLNNIKRFIKG